MSFRPSAPHKKPRWLLLFGVVLVVGGLIAAPVLAVAVTDIPDAAYIGDDGLANDEPGQKDLTAQGSAFVGGHVYSGWKWDDTSWSGNNTGDGCNLFDGDGDGKVNYSICATIGTVNGSLSLISVTVYSCSDKHAYKCTNPVQRAQYTTTASTYCAISNTASGHFDATDTVIVCDVTALATASGVSGLPSATLINTCSYPSREPNSDFSDCIFEAPAPTAVTVGTDSDSSTLGTWNATIRDTATLNPNDPGGSVTFELHTNSTCTAAVTGSSSTDSDGTDGFAATPVAVSGTGEGTFEYWWKVTYTPSAGFAAPASPLCGEKVTITTSISGTSQ